MRDSRSKMIPHRAALSVISISPRIPAMASDRIPMSKLSIIRHMKMTANQKMKVYISPSSRV
jgi:hypothetical protein